MAVVLEGKESIELDIPDKEILRLIGYKTKRKEPPQNIYNIILEERKQLNQLLVPKAVYQIFNSYELKPHKVFERADKIALCICTIGSELEQRVAKLFESKEMLRGFILDAFGSEATEQVADWANSEICHQAFQLKLNHSSRFSPGYGDWSLEEQEYIFKLLPADTINVNLTSSMMMIPRKSISFAVKLGIEDFKEEQKTLCENCNLRFSCNYRRDT